MTTRITGLKTSNGSQTRKDLSPEKLCDIFSSVLHDNKGAISRLKFFHYNQGRSQDFVKGAGERTPEQEVGIFLLNFLWSYMPCCISAPRKSLRGEEEQS